MSPVVAQRLTRQEHTVLALIAEGRSNAGIAERLGLTTRTVETHTSRIFTKLDLEAHPSIHRRVLAAVTYHQSDGGSPGRRQPGSVTPPRQPGSSNPSTRTP